MKNCKAEHFTHLFSVEAILTGVGVNSDMKVNEILAIYTVLSLYLTEDYVYTSDTVLKVEIYSIESNVVNRLIPILEG